MCFFSDPRRCTILWDQHLDQIDENVKMFMDLDNAWLQKADVKFSQLVARKVEKY